MHCYYVQCIKEHYIQLLEDLKNNKIQTFDFCRNIEKDGFLSSDIADMLKSNMILLTTKAESLTFYDLFE